MGPSWVHHEGNVANVYIWLCGFISETSKTYPKCEAQRIGLRTVILQPFYFLFAF